jgi:glucan phosphoethanolaminetransferase (alkaline phosphatase superfamily)
MINNITREFITNKIFLWIAVGFGLFFGVSALNIFKFSNETLHIILIASGIICILFFLLTIFSRKHMLYIATLSGYLIDFYDFNPSKELITKFLDSLKKHSYKYLKEKYTRIDEDLPFEKQLDNFIYLRDKKVISQKEYIALKKKLKNLEPDVKGFRY